MADILYGLTEMCDQIGLCYFMFSPATSPKLMIFKKTLYIFGQTLFKR